MCPICGSTRSGLIDRLCAGTTTCATAGATNNPGPGSHDVLLHQPAERQVDVLPRPCLGITRLNVYAGEAAGYLIQDNVEQALVNGGTVNGRTFTAGTIPSAKIPLVIQDKTFVDAATIGNTDPTWNWGTTPRTPNTGDLWWPHVYMPAENPFNLEMDGMNPYGRWFYGPWFYPATPLCFSAAEPTRKRCRRIASRKGRSRILFTIPPVFPILRCFEQQLLPAAGDSRHAQRILGGGSVPGHHAGQRHRLPDGHGAAAGLPLPDPERRP